MSRSVLLQLSAQLTLGFIIVFLSEFDMLNTNMKVLFVANKYFSRYKHFCFALKSH